MINTLLGCSHVCPKRNGYVSKGYALTSHMIFELVPSHKISIIILCICSTYLLNVFTKNLLYGLISWDYVCLVEPSLSLLCKISSMRLFVPSFTFCIFISSKYNKHLFHRRYTIHDQIKCLTTVVIKKT